MSRRSCAERSSTFLTFWIAWYIGTVPIGTGLAATIARRMASMLPPVERSITVSAPRSTAILSLESSLSISEVTAELPMFALILHFALMPIPIGSRPRPDVHLVGGDDHPSPRDLGADQLRLDRLAAGDVLHLGGDDPSAGFFQLRHGADDLRRRDGAGAKRAGDLPAAGWWAGTAFIVVGGSRSGQFTRSVRDDGEVRRAKCRVRESHHAGDIERRPALSRILLSALCTPDFPGRPPPGSGRNPSEPVDEPDHRGDT